MDIGMKKLESGELTGLIKSGAMLVDLRDAVPFGVRHVDQSIHVKVKSPDFAERIEYFVSRDNPIVLLAETLDDADWAAAEIGRRRPGRVKGYLLADEFLPVCQLPLRSLRAVSAEELRDLDREGDVFILDVREDAEWRLGQISGAHHIPMRDVLGRIETLPRDVPLVIMCAGGQRSSLIASLLMNRGFRNPVNLTGGMGGWIKAGFTPVRADS